MSRLIVLLEDFGGSPCVDVYVGDSSPHTPQLDDQNQPILDARGNPVFVDAQRLYLADVPGGPSWPTERIDLAVEMLNQLLPAGWAVGWVREDPGRAHISAEIRRVE